MIGFVLWYPRPYLRLGIEQGMLVPLIDVVQSCLRERMEKGFLAYFVVLTTALLGRSGST